jgi:hypothetical protein
MIIAPSTKLDLDDEFSVTPAAILMKIAVSE